MKKLIAPSVMCADMMNVAKDVSLLENAGVDLLHVDVMDGHFVPNLTLGTDFIKALRAVTSLPLDIHLMVEKPEEMLAFFEIGEGDMVSVHIEATHHLQKALAAIRARGAKAFAALNPATPLNTLDYVLPDLDGVLVMTVNPGFAAQKMVPTALDKIADTRRYLDGHGYPALPIEVDGNVSFENAVLMSKAGANIFVGGTSSVFRKGVTIGDNVTALRGCINE